MINRHLAIGRHVTLGILLGCVSTGAGAQPIQGRLQLESLARRADERIRALQLEADELATQERTLLGDLRGLELERRMKTEELGRIEGDLGRTAGELADVEAQVAELEQEADAQRPDVEARLRELYKLGRPGYLRLLLGLEDFSAVMRAYQTVAMLAERDRRTIEALETRWPPCRPHVPRYRRGAMRWSPCGTKRVEPAAPSTRRSPPRRNSWSRSTRNKI